MSAAVSIAAKQRKGRRRSEIMGECCVWVVFGVSEEKDHRANGRTKRLINEKQGFIGVSGQTFTSENGPYKQ